MPKHVVLLEAGGKQDFIFTSNKQAVNIGASELISRSGKDWINDATAGLDGVEELVLMSGKAVLVVPDLETGRQIVRHVTERALYEAPGLDVTGVVCPMAGSLGATVKAAHEKHREVRRDRPARQLRWPTLPFSQPCQYSSLPATVVGREGDTEDLPRSEPIDAAWRMGSKGRDRMAATLTIGDALLETKYLDRGVCNAGWIAVVHADGNGIGALFRHLANIEDDGTYRGLYEMLSDKLDEITKKAFSNAVTEARRRPVSEPPPTGWVLPIVVGGDDVTAIMDARLAFDTVRRFLERFEKLSAESEVPSLLEMLWEDSGAPGTAPSGFTGAAGIAFVKPHHPFSDAYGLAEELCESAKLLKNVDGVPRSALDFHVLHDSVGRPLRDLRTDQVTDDTEGHSLRRWAGPYLVGAPTTNHAERHVSQLEEAVEKMRSTTESAAVLPPGSAHRLRAALVSGGAAIDRERKQVQAWQDDPEPLRTFLDAHLRVEPPPLPNAPGDTNLPFTRIFDALHLLDMERGTTTGERDGAAPDHAENGARR
jgi:hypothetical protein